MPEKSSSQAKTTNKSKSKVSFDGKYLVGRTRNDVPEEDGIVYIKRTDENENLLNQFIWCKIVDVSDYDLIAEVE